MISGIAIVSTVRAVGRPLRSFLRYHQAIGVSGFYLFFDDPRDRDLGWASRWPGVRAIACDAALRRAQARRCRTYRKMKPHFRREVMARQIVNAEDGVLRARADGFAWIVHIDADELVYIDGNDTLPEHLRRLERCGADTVIFVNFEAVPERMEVGDPFREVTLFKRNLAHLSGRARKKLPVLWDGREYFMAYKNGKAAARLAALPIPRGVHRFRGRRAPLREIVSEDAFVLHYPSCGFRRYRQKYELLGRFPDVWFGWAPIRNTFHLRSRDMQSDGERTAARRFYRTHVVLDDPSVVRRLSRAGYLRRLTRPARLIAKAEARRLC